MATPPKKPVPVNSLEFLGWLKIPQSKIRSVYSINVMHRMLTPYRYRPAKNEPMRNDYKVTVLLELVRESNRKNYLMVFIRPKNEHDEEGDGLPIVLDKIMMQEDSWSTSEDEDEGTVYGTRNHYDYVVAREEWEEKQEREKREKAEERENENADNDDEDDNEEANEDTDQEVEDVDIADDLAANDADDLAANDADDLAADERDDRAPEGHYNSMAGDLAYFTAEENSDTDDTDDEAADEEAEDADDENDDQAADD